MPVDAATFIMNQPQFTIRRFENRNGVVSWRVSGSLNGERIRRNFKTREEAAAEKGVLEIRAVQSTSGLRAIATALTEAQVREAEALYRRMEGKSHPLSFYVDFALANYQEPRERKSLSDGITAYIKAKEHEFDEGNIRYAQLKRIGWDLRRLERHFPGKTIAEIVPPAITDFLERRGNGLKTYNNQRGTLGTFFKYAFQRGWINENPIPKVPHFRLRQCRGMATTFTVEQSRELMEYFETFEGGRWIPYFALCLFAGIRPGVPDGEISKLETEHVNLRTGVIKVPVKVSKVREPRQITIQPNLAAWLIAYPLDKFPIVPGDFQKRRAKFRDRFKLTHDVLRHTFISMFVAKFRSFGEAAIQAGNSEAIIRKHYLDLKSQEEADAFFAIFPKGGVINAEPSASLDLRAPEHRMAS